MISPLRSCNVIDSVVYHPQETLVLTLTAPHITEGGGLFWGFGILGDLVWRGLASLAFLSLVGRGGL